MRRINAAIPDPGGFHRFRVDRFRELLEGGPLAGLSRRQQAAALGCSVPYLTKLLNEERANPSTDYLARIANALDVPVGELVRMSPPTCSHCGAQPYA